MRAGALPRFTWRAAALTPSRRLRSRLDKLGKPDLPLIFPPPHLCTGAPLLPPSPLLFRPSLPVVVTAHPRMTLRRADNAAMIAWVGLDRLERGLVDPLTVMQRAKWPINECEADFVTPDTSSRLVA